jgi:SAM-dependent methyltransferase
LRDWTNTSELEAAVAMIGAALEQVFRDPSGQSIAFAGCGAGGLLAEISTEFGRVLGYDLTLPVLGAARHLLDGNSLDLALPRAIKETGHIHLRKRDPSSSTSHIQLQAMDVFDTAFNDESIDCVITAFLIDLIPDPQRLTAEIHRILRANGVWINYGPSGPLTALWRFDRAESAAFVEASGFTVVHTDAHRTTYLDVSGDCPAWSFRSHMCYLTSARKTGALKDKPRAAKPVPAELAQIVPRHLPGAAVIRRERLGTADMQTITMRHERIPGAAQSFDIDGDTARIMALVDGERSVLQIAELLEKSVPAQAKEETIKSFARYLRHGLLSWQGA